MGYPCLPAGSWDKAETVDGRDPELALVTMAPEPKFGPYHNRQPLFLVRDEYAAWLESPETATALFQRPKTALLSIQRATT